MNGSRTAIESDFTVRDLWDFAIENDLEDTHVVISSHGERYGVGWIGNDHGQLWLGDLCEHYVGINPAAVSVPDNPEGTKRARAKLAEELAAHLEDVAARLRMDFPA